MNREIQFRGKTFPNSNLGEIWVYGFLNVVEAEGQEYYYIFWQGHSTPVVKESVGQFTGLKDITGKNYFEGDIVSYYYDGELDSVGYIQEDPFLLSWTNDCYGEKWGWDLLTESGHCHNYYYGGFSPNEFNIIGNIYDNPELLKNK